MLSSDQSGRPVLNGIHNLNFDLIVPLRITRWMRSLKKMETRSLGSAHANFLRCIVDTGTETTRTFWHDNLGLNKLTGLGVSGMGSVMTDFSRAASAGGEQCSREYMF